jgi:hydrogenase maturation protein HypF
LATALNLSGWVHNNCGGVVVEVEGPAELLDKFQSQLQRELPPLARIDSLQAEQILALGEDRFEIRVSQTAGAAGARIMPDIATCEDCRADIFDPENRRYRYPFTNCTNCGPRFSIIESLPYDRANTSMKIFEMCSTCRAEYENPKDRRFHAQPTACPKCGPRLMLISAAGKILALKDDALVGACELVREGSILALKGLGGFQLIVDARREEAVACLRRRKARPKKPFAVMAPSLENAQVLCDVSEDESAQLQSPAAPIVLLQHNEGESTIATSVAPGNPYLGVMLPYTPLHHLLMHDLGFPVVATSGNLSDEPICIDNEEAIRRLVGIADYFLLHDRPIVRQIDDSVLQVVDETPMLLRQARGFAPVSIDLSQEGPQILALGAHLKNSVALSQTGTAILGQYIGDLESRAATQVFEREVQSMLKLNRAVPERVVVDLHPDYFPTRRGSEMGLPVVQVQHHLAHILSCMAENHLQSPVLGVAWDGTGLGTDGTIWGGEFLLITKDSWKRVAHLRKFRLPGGDLAARDARRSALGVLHELQDDKLISNQELCDLLDFKADELKLIMEALKKNLNSPLTSSMGRLFDAVAALTGICSESSFEGEAAMLLQYAAEGSATEEAYSFDLKGDAPLKLDWEPVIREILADHAAGVSAAIIAAKLHRALAQAIVAITETCGIEQIALSGGCFQNRLLLSLTREALRRAGKQVYSHHIVPPNDSGIALGQLLAAEMNLREEK